MLMRTREEDIDTYALRREPTGLFRLGDQPTASLSDRRREAGDRFPNELNITSSKQLVHKRPPKNTSAHVGYGQLVKREPRRSQPVEHIEECGQRLFLEEAEDKQFCAEVLAAIDR